MGLFDQASDPATITVGATAAEVLADHPGKRVAFVVQNVHATNRLYLGFGPNADDVTTSTGILLEPGASYSDDGERCYSGAVWAVASGAGTDVRRVEF